jgi:hypothetical protein
VLAAYHKYGDRTEITDKSLKGTKEALDGLQAYVSRGVAEAIKPTVERILAGATFVNGTIEGLKAEAVLEELQGEAFLDDVASFVNRDIEELSYFRSLVHARSRWSTWARRMSWGLFALLIVQGIFLVSCIVLKSCAVYFGLEVMLTSFAISVAMAAFCVVCAGGMLYYHDQISNYRDKIL